jgi:hypothetical protein
MFCALYFVLYFSVCRNAQVLLATLDSYQSKGLSHKNKFANKAANSYFSEFF